MITKEQVESFLEELHTKIKIFGILFRDDRDKNRKTLQELEIVPSYRKVVVENLMFKVLLLTNSIVWAKCGYLAKMSKVGKSI